MCSNISKPFPNLPTGKIHNFYKVLNFAPKRNRIDKNLSIQEESYKNMIYDEMQTDHNLPDR